MRGRVELWDNANAASARVGHDVPQVSRRVRVRAAVLEGVALRQQRVRLELERPALVVRQVQVQHVHLRVGREVDDHLDGVCVQVGARRVEHDAAVREARRVGHVGRGDGVLPRARVEDEHLRQRLERAQRAEAARGRDDDGRAVADARLQRVALVRAQPQPLVGRRHVDEQARDERRVARARRRQRVGREGEEHGRRREAREGREGPPATDVFATCGSSARPRRACHPQPPVRVPNTRLCTILAQKTHYQITRSRRGPGREAWPGMGSVASRVRVR